jgi:hypothetical protein
LSKGTEGKSKDLEDASCIKCRFREFSPRTLTRHPERSPLREGLLCCCQEHHASGSPFALYSLSLLCSVFKLIPNNSAVRVLFPRVLLRVARIIPCSTSSIRLGTGKETVSRPSCEFGDSALGMIDVPFPFRSRFKGSRAKPHLKQKLAASINCCWPHFGQYMGIGQSYDRRTRRNRQ